MISPIRYIPFDCIHCDFLNQSNCRIGSSNFFIGHNRPCQISHFATLEMLNIISDYHRALWHFRNWAWSSSTQAFVGRQRPHRPGFPNSLFSSWHFYFVSKKFVHQLWRPWDSKIQDGENVEVLRSPGSFFSSFVIIDLIDFESMLLV